jgi:hypothetical protein
MRSLVLLTSLTVVLAACGPGLVPRQSPGPVVEPPTIRDNLRWRTGWAYQQHLMQALALPEALVCNELGLLPCVTRPASERPFRGENIPVGTPVPHLVALGGNDPFDQSHYVAAHTPGATTPVAVDRVALAACDARVEQDRLGTPVVFTALDFAATSVNEAAAAATARTLFSRFHLRDATAAELAGIQTLTTDDANTNVGPADFAIAACFAVASMSESVFD